jgi:hypothetical protein
VLSFFPLLAFIIAAVTELRFCTTNLVTIRNLIPSTLGIAAFWLLWNPDAMSPRVETGPSHRVMAISSAAALDGVWRACSGVDVNVQPWLERANRIPKTKVSPLLPFLFDLAGEMRRY